MKYLLKNNCFTGETSWKVIFMREKKWRGWRERERGRHRKQRDKEGETETAGQRQKAERWTGARDRGMTIDSWIVRAGRNHSEQTRNNFTDTETEAKKVVCQSHKDISSEC